MKTTKKIIIESCIRCPNHRLLGFTSYCATAHYAYVKTKGYSSHDTEVNVATLNRFTIDNTGNPPTGFKFPEFCTLADNVVEATP